jgi:L-iditol 2-dehydrogenase
MSMEMGALLEPLGVAIHAYRRSLMKEGQTALVLGAGAVGLLAAAVATAKGAKRVVIADIDAGRVDFAVKNGFAHQGYLVPMKRGKDTEENLAIARETADGVAAVTDDSGTAIGEVDVVFECTGVPTCVQSAIYVSLPSPPPLPPRSNHPSRSPPNLAAA